MQVRSFLTAGTCVQPSQFFREGGDPAWVPGTLQGVGVSIARLLDIYNRLYTAKDSVWLTSGDELHILKVSFLLRISPSWKICRIRFYRPFFPTLPQLQAKFPRLRGGSSQLYARSLFKFSCNSFFPVDLYSELCRNSGRSVHISGRTVYETDPRNHCHGLHLQVYHQKFRNSIYIFLYRDIQAKLERISS